MPNGLGFRWCYHRAANAAAILTAGYTASLLQQVIAATAGARPCDDTDWQFDFSECVQSPDGAGLVRGAFAFAPYPGVCDLSLPGSRPLPAPLTGLPCQEPCEIGTRLAIRLAETPQSRTQAPGGLQVGCYECEPGRFSLGGGSLTDGASGDWGRPWPAGLSTTCLYREDDYNWHVGGAARLACVLHLQLADGNGILTETREGTWNQELSDEKLTAPVSVIDGLACEPLSGAEAFRGAAVLVMRGTCTFVTKAAVLAAAGAVAVIIYNNEPDAPYFHPAAPPNSTDPTIPMLMITLEDGDLWKQNILALTSANSTVTPMLQVPSPHCSPDRFETPSEAFALVNLTESNTDEELGNMSLAAEESWDTIVGRRGCSAWVSDPAGGFLHSGDNRHYHWIYSILTLTIRFVHDGYLRFRYSVDSEDPYDGLIFEMDGKMQWDMQSLESPYKTFRVDVPRGSHSFDWIYKKDFSTSHGEDRARLQLLEISGSDYADRECHNCFGISSNAADGRCEQCERDEYAEVVSTSSRCVPCPAGYWASPGSVGSSSCHERRACTAQDVEATYAAIQDTAGQGGATPGPICRGNLTMARVRWRQPMTCNPKRPGSIALQDVSSTGELGEQQPCPPCQPHEWRPTGSACEPLRSQSCPPGLHALPERVVSYWHVWPRNFTGWIWGAGGEDTEDQSHGWQLSRNGAAAVVGTAFIGGGGAEIVSLINSEARADQACLTMDVTLESRGVLRFFVEVQPSWAWGQAAALYVDHEPRIVQFSEDEEEPAAVREIVLNLEAGQHAITWVWRYDWAMEDDEEPGDSDYGVELDEEEVKVETAPAGSGLRLLNISVTNVAGAGSGSCRHCPAGQGLPSPSSATCQPCPPGRSSTDYTSGIAKEDSGTCKPCPAGRSSSGDGGLGSESCRDCGPGLQSLEGAGYCEPLASIGHWSSHAIEAAWHIGQAAVLNSASNSGLRMVRIEDRVFYIDLFTPRQRPDGPSFEFEAEGATATAASQPLASLAFWWEWLPPREELIGYLDSGCEARGGSYVRAVGDVIEGIDVADPSADGPTGLWASFSGLCEETGSAPRVRRAQIFLHCDLFQSPEDLSLSFMDGMRPSSEDGRSCEDFALEWRTSAACPVCSESSWRPVFAGGCEETGRKVTYMADPPCSGGAPAPKDRWQPCPGPVDLLMLGGVAGGFLLGLTCLFCYVLLLRRRYSKYMVLEEGANGRPGAARAPPISIGASGI